MRIRTYTIYVVYEYYILLPSFQLKLYEIVDYPQLCLKHYGIYRNLQGHLK